MSALGVSFSGGVILVAVALALGASAALAEEQAVGPYKDFKGTIRLDVRDSKADWGPFTPKKAPAGAPNILFVLYDDTGLAAWSPYGGRINMPTLDKLADNGLCLEIAGGMTVGELQPLVATKRR